MNTNPKKEKIFVTGSTGFIGYNFIKRAIKKGYEIKALRRNKLIKFNSEINNKIEFIDGSIENFNQKSLEGCNILVHLAASGVGPKKADLKELLLVNVLGTSKIIESAYKAKIEKIIVVGTCHEYGDVDLSNQPIKVDYPLKPLNLYGITKATSYYIALEQCKKYNLKMFYGRIFSAYGEGQYSANFWPALKKAALTGDNFKMTKGEQIRDFIHIEEVIDQLLQACKRNDLIPGKVLVKNIASGNSMKLGDFAESEWANFCAKGKLLKGIIKTRLNEPLCFKSDLKEKFL